MEMFNFLLSGAAFDPSMLVMPICMLLLIVFFIFSWRSNKKKEKQEAEERDNLQIGDEVTTIGGIIGKVVSIKEETFVLESTKDKTKIRFLRGAIRSIDVKIADVVAAKAAEANMLNGEPVAEVKEDEKNTKKDKKDKKKAKTDADNAESANNQ